MMKEKLQLRRILSLLAIVAGVVSVPVFFNSCGQGPQLSGAHNADLQALRSDAKASGVYNNDSALCTSSYNYVCEHHIYSPDAPDAQKVEEFPCVDTPSGKLCVHGYKLGHNSDSAIEGCDSQECRDSYVYEEYRCYNNKVLFEGIYIVDAKASSLDETLLAVQAQCSGLQGE